VTEAEQPRLAQRVAGEDGVAVLAARLELATGTTDPRQLDELHAERVVHPERASEVPGDVAGAGARAPTIRLADQQHVRPRQRALQQRSRLLPGPDPTLQVEGHHHQLASG
jgi:hypothetical protein